MPFGPGFVVVEQVVQFTFQVDLLSVEGVQFIVGLGQEQHVADHLRHAFVLLHVGVEDLLILLRTAHLGEGDLGLGHQVGDRGAQFVGDVGGKVGEPVEGLFHALQHFVE